MGKALNSTDEINYPKILILGGQINRHDGGGITISNLFSRWPKNKISMVSNAIEKEGLEICQRYYRLGNDELKRPWPFSLFQPYYHSEFLEVNSLSKDEARQYSFKNSKYNPGVKSLFFKILHFLGIYYFLFPVRMSKKLERWLRDENPDVIYTLLGTPQIITLATQVTKKINSHLVVHMMDDWPKGINQPGLSWLYWNSRIKRDFRFLMGRSSQLLSICQAMSDEYRLRYGFDFKPFHNCIDIDFWGKSQRQTWENGKPFKILYAGKIGYGVQQSVITIAEAVEKVANRGIEVEFLIQSRAIPENFITTIKKFKHTNLGKFVDYSDLPQCFSSADLLVLPMDYAKKSLNFIHLSLQTKVPEYMMSGSPILVFAHSCTALYKYLVAGKWGYAVEENNSKKLANMIEHIIQNPDERANFAKQAVSLACANHDKNVVRLNFHRTLAEVGNSPRPIIQVI